MTNADVDGCAWLLAGAEGRKPTGKATPPWTRATAAQHLAGLLAAPRMRVFVWRDPRCTPIAFVAGELCDDHFQVSLLCVSRRKQGDGLGLHLLQQVQRTLGVGHVELAESLSSQRARQILHSL